MLFDVIVHVDYYFGLLIDMFLTSTTAVPLNYGRRHHAWSLHSFSSADNLHMVLVALLY